MSITISHLVGKENGVDILVGAKDHVMSLPALPTDVTEACCGTIFGC
jgi:hypothetical protein